MGLSRRCVALPTRGALRGALSLPVTLVLLLACGPHPSASFTRLRALAAAHPGAPTPAPGTGTGTGPPSGGAPPPQGPPSAGSGAPMAPPPGAPGQAPRCVVPFRGKRRKYQHCTYLDEAGDFLLAWDWSNDSSSALVWFSGTAAAPWTWAGWAINPSAIQMADSNAIVAFANPDRLGQLAVNPFYLTSTSAEELQVNSTNGKWSVARGVVLSQKEGVEVVANGTKFRFLVGIVGLPPGEQIVVWRGGLAVKNFTAGLLGPHGNTTAYGRNIDFSTGNVSALLFPGTPWLNQKVVHAWLAAIGYGVLLPLGILVARHVKVWVDPLWFYAHIGFQLSGYILGAVGWGYGIWLKTKFGNIQSSPSYQYAHYCIGITIFCTSTLQVLTPILKPHKGLPVRLYWNLVHWGLGYVSVILAFVNIFLGFTIMRNESINYGGWQTGYIIFLAAWGALMILLEPLSWYVWWQKRGEEEDEEYDEEDGKDYDDEEEEEEEEEGEDEHDKRSDHHHDEEDDDDDDDDRERKNRKDYDD